MCIRIFSCSEVEAGIILFYDFLRTVEYVCKNRFESVESICRVLNCGADDILEFVSEDNGGKKNG